MIKTFSIKDLVFNDNVLVVSRQKENNGYTFYIFDDVDIEKNTNKYIKWIIKKPNTDLFETITRDISNIYFDIDLPNNVKEIGLTKLQMNNIINDLIIKFNKYYKLENVITVDDLLMFMREETDNMIRSLHIIIPAYKTHKSINQHFIKTQLHSSSNDVDTPSTNYIDYKVYNPKQQFNLPYHTKNKYNHKRCLISYHYDENSKCNKDSLDKCNKDSLDKCNNVQSKYDNMTDYDKFKQHSLNIPNDSKYIDISDEMTESINDEMYKDVDIQLKKCDISPSNTSLLELQKYIPKFDDDDTIAVNKYNLVNTLIELLPSTVYNNTMNREWTSLTNYLFLYDIDDFDKWIDYSSDKSSDVDIYDKNKIYVKQLTKDSTDSKNINNFIYNCICVINRNHNLKLYYHTKNTFDTPQLREWIAEKTNMDKNTIKIILQDIKPNDNTKYISLTDDCIFYVCALDLYWKSTEKRLNYWIDVVYNENKIVNDIIEYKSIVEIGKTCLSWIDTTDDKIININAKWSSGKTYHILSSLLLKVIGMGWRVLIISENNILNRSMKTDVVELLKDFGDDIVENHINIDKFKESHKVCITSTESLAKVNGTRFDLVINDEYESICNHYESNTHKYTTAYECLTVWENKMKISKKIINLDADLSMSRILPLYKTLGLLNGSSTPKIIYCGDNKWIDYKFNIYLKECEFLNNIISDIKLGKRLCIASLCKSKAVILYEMLLKLNVKINILCVWSEICKFNDTDIIDTESLKDNIEKYIICNNIDILIYSPTIKTGLSINEENYFHKTYMIANTRGSVCGREALQMLFRSRSLKDKEINILISSLKHITPSPTLKRAELHLTSKLNILEHSCNKKNDTVMNTDLNKSNFNTSEFYKDIRIQNCIESFSSDSNLPHEILRRLTINHNIPVKIIHEDKIKYSDIQENIKDARSNIKYNKINTLIY